MQYVRGKLGCCFKLLPYAHTTTLITLTSPFSVSLYYIRLPLIQLNVMKRHHVTRNMLNMRAPFRINSTLSKNDLTATAMCFI